MSTITHTKAKWPVPGPASQDCRDGLHDTACAGCRCPCHRDVRTRSDGTPPTLTEDQGRQLQQARDLLDALDSDDEILRAHVGEPALAAQSTVYAVALGQATTHLRDLLAMVSALTGGGRS